MFLNTNFTNNTNICRDTFTIPTFVKFVRFVFKIKRVHL